MSHLIVGWAIGYPELLIVGVVVLLLFGHRLPGVMRSLGRGVVEFKKGISGSDDEGSEIEDAKSGEKS
jgi:sec-independent protein translocase protein TatA